MKRIKAILVATCLAYVASKNGLPYSKEVYCGDTSQVDAAVKQRAAKDATLSFTRYADSNDPKFLAVVVDSTTLRAMQPK